MNTSGEGKQNNSVFKHGIKMGKGLRFSELVFRPYQLWGHSLSISFIIESHAIFFTLKYFWKDKNGVKSHRLNKFPLRFGNKYPISVKIVS